jgi:lipopolysaccharide transport system ATP-binding protein
MRMRLAFAVAAHLDSDILIVDEVLAVGDAAFQKKCIGKIGDVSKTGRTILFVSHNMVSIQNLCEIGFLLKDGRLDFCGPSNETISRYLQAKIYFNELEITSTTERTGNQLVKVTNISVCDYRSKPTNEIELGKGCKIYVDFESKNGFVPKNVEIGIAFISLFGVKTVMFSNLVAGYPFERLPGIGRICCSIPSMPIAEGDYFLGVSFSSNGELNDWLDRVGKISVNSSDFYGSGKSYRPGSTHMYLEHSWEII